MLMLGQQEPFDLISGLNGLSFGQCESVFAER